MEFWNALSGEIQGAIITLIFAGLAVLTGKTRNPFDNLLLAWFRRKWRESEDNGA